MVILWLSLLAISVALEIYTRKMFFVPFSFGAIISFVLELCGSEPIIQVIVFVAVSIILLLVRIFLGNYIFLPVKTISLEETVGQRCVVVDKIDNFAGCGMVRVGGGLWAARGAYDDDVFEIGESLSVVAIEGVKLICRKI